MSLLFGKRLIAHEIITIALKLIITIFFKAPKFPLRIPNTPDACSFGLTE